jgi:hypothetical protein
VPALLRFSVKESPSTRRHALRALLCVHGVDEVPASLSAHLPSYLHVLSSLTKDTDVEVRRLVCASLVSLVPRTGQQMLEVIPSLFDFFMHVTEEEAEGPVVLAACEFWSVVCDTSVAADPTFRAFYLSKLNRCVPCTLVVSLCLFVSLSLCFSVSLSLSVLSYLRAS